jgi:hypothetical protein
VHASQLDVVAGLEVELRRLADGLDDDVVVLTAGRCLVGGDVGNAHQRRLPLLLRGRLGCFRALHVGREGLGAGEQLLLLVALGLRDQLAELLLLGPLGLEVGDRRPARGVRGDGPVHDVGGQPALGLGGAHAVGVVSEHLRVDHVARLSGYVVALTGDSGAGA